MSVWNEWEDQKTMAPPMQGEEEQRLASVLNDPLVELAFNQALTAAEARGYERCREEAETICAKAAVEFLDKDLQDTPQALAAMVLQKRVRSLKP